MELFLLENIKICILISAIKKVKMKDTMKKNNNIITRYFYTLITFIKS